MCLGVMPSDAIGRVYGLNELVAMGNAAKRGDVRLFEQLLQQHQTSFVRIGVYLVLEQVKIIAFRNLFRRIALLSSSARLNLSLIQTILREMNEEMDLDEIECIIANLIYQKKLNGYMSHKLRMLVMSKTDAFPTSAVIKKAKLS
jgi:hypothetical protein